MKYVVEGIQSGIVIEPQITGGFAGGVKKMVEGIATVDLELGDLKIKGDKESVLFEDHAKEDSFELTWEEIYDACDLWRE